MSQKSPQELQQMIQALEKRLNELTEGATRNVNRIDTETVPGLRTQIDQLAKRVTDLEKYVRTVQKTLAARGIKAPTL